MTRDKALETMDRLLIAGYDVTLHALAERTHGHLVDVKALTAIADELGVDCGFSSLSGGFRFTALDTTPAVVRNPRQHPR